MGFGTVAAAFRLLPRLRLDVFSADRDTFRRLLGFGVRLQVSRFANLVSFQADRLIISYFLGIHLVAFYQLGAAVLSHARQIPLLLISALIPAVSEMEQLCRHAYLQELYVRGSRYLIAMSLPFLFFLLAGADEIMFIWMGLGYERSAWVIRVLAVGYSAATVTGVASSIAAGCARTDIDMKFGLLMAGMNLFLSIVLAMAFGFKGVVIGTCISLTLASAYFVRLFHRHVIRMPQVEFYRLFLLPAVCCLVAVFFMSIPDIATGLRALSLSRVARLWLLLLKAVLFFAAYAACLLQMRYFDAYDLGVVREKLLCRLRSFSLTR